MSDPAAGEFTVPVHQRYFEDYVPGATGEFGSVEVDEGQIISFAEEFDPQPFHTDPEAAVEGPFGGLTASGWHTTGLMMRLFADHYLSKVASLGGPGGRRTPVAAPGQAGRRAAAARDGRRCEAVAVQARPRTRSHARRDDQPGRCDGSPTDGAQLPAPAQSRFAVTGTHDGPCRGPPPAPSSRRNFQVQRWRAPRPCGPTSSLQNW